MKKIFTLAFSILFSVSFLQAQVTMTRSSHGFNPGDTHATQEVEFKEPGSGGKGATWDFRSLVPVGDPDLSFANEAAGKSHNIGVTRSSDNIETFYNVTDNANEYRGYKSGDYMIYFDQPIVKTKYPQTYGASFEGTFEGNMSYGTKPVGHISGAYSTEVDASGTILLPGDISVPVIRVKTMERITGFACNCGNNDVVIEKYLWYAQDVRFPVFVSIETTTKDGVTRHSYLNTKVEQSQVKNAFDPADIAYTVSPNPFKDNIQISYTLPQEMKVSIDFYSAQGIKLASILPVRMQNGEQTVSFYAAPYAQREGVYFVIMQFGDKTYSAKVVRN